MAGEDPSKCPCDGCVDYRRRASILALPPRERAKVNRPRSAPSKPEKSAPRKRQRNPYLVKRFRRIRAADRVCRYCLAAPAESVDHIVPLARGGSNREENLVGCCIPCNHAKGARLPKELGWVLHVPIRLVPVKPVPGE